MAPFRPDEDAAPLVADSRCPLRIAVVLSALLHGGGFLTFAALHEAQPPEPPQVLTLVYLQAGGLRVGDLQMGDLTGAPAEAAGNAAAAPDSQTAAPRSEAQSSSSQETVAEAPVPEARAVAPQAEQPDPVKLAQKPPPPRRKPSVPQPSEKIPSAASREEKADDDQVPESLAAAKESPLFARPPAEGLLADAAAEKLAVPGVQTAALPSGGGLRSGSSQGAATATAARYSGEGLSNSKPRYPYSSRRRGEEGRVVLRVRVTVSGAPAEVRVLSSSGFRRLDQAALRAVKSWRFLPARRNGKNVAGSVEVPVTFNLTDG